MKTSLNLVVLDAVDLQLVALDSHGNIAFANAAWRQAAQNAEKIRGAKHEITGTAYRMACEAANGPGSADIDEAISGIQSVINGSAEEYRLGYRLVIDSETRHFELHAMAYSAPEATAVVSHRETAREPGSNSGLDFEQMFEHSANEIFLGHLQTMEVQWINERARTNLGYTLNEIRALPPLGFLSGVDSDQMEIALQDLTDGSRQILEMQTTHIRKDGSTYPASAQLQVMELSGQSMLVATAQDISEVSNTRRELARARMFLESAPDATVVADENGLIVAANNQVTKLLGYSSNEIIGQPVETLVPERLHKQHIQHRTMFARDPKVRFMGTGLNLYAQAKDGRELPIEVSLSPMKTGGQTLVAAALRDITQRLSMEQAQRDSDAKYRELFENSTDLIQSFNSRGEIEFVNPAWLQAMEYNEDQLSEIRFMDLIAPQSKVYAEQITARLRDGATVNDIEITYLTRTGKEMHLEGSATWLVAEGQRVASRAILHDVTEIKRNEAMLREARDVAEQATVGKSRFLAAASHDLRQPLQALRLYLSVMQRQASEPKLLEVAGKMSTSLETMGELLDALLDISRLDGGAVDPEITEFSVRDLLQGIFTSNVPQAESKGLTLELTGSDFTVRSDPGLLARIIDNFVSNAIRYTVSGGITLHSELVNERVLVSVRDTGVGIPESEIDQVFEEYYQLDNDTRDRRKGLGLGLSIVKHIANLLETPISASSAPGQGSTFSVSLPLVQTSVDQPVNDRSTHPDNNAASDRSPKILFVDDDPAIIDATAMLLESVNFTVQAVLNGNEALAALDAGPRPDVLVTDYRLPGHNGVEVARHARAIYGAELPVVIMTGDTTIHELEDTAIGRYTLLRKPVDTEALIKLIEELSSQGG